jgi:hypothetical protein
LDASNLSIGAQFWLWRGFGDDHAAPMTRA